ncbi:hypothetical protein [Clostridium sp.]|uniref:hypothetical protein n=1 Tax=Clostridium sp. TaxID=1506 RepID=UPI002FCB3A3C
MRNEKLEKAIKKIDKEIVALKVASKYLSNKDEINEVKDTLNKKRQVLADALYQFDNQYYEECCDVIADMLNKELGEEEQRDLLYMIKEKFGRQAPNITKKSNGLNAWLNELAMEFEWVENDGSDWAMLVITGFGVRQ